MVKTNNASGAKATTTNASVPSSSSVAEFSVVSMLPMPEQSPTGKCCSASQIADPFSTGAEDATEMITASTRLHCISATYYARYATKLG